MTNTHNEDKTVLEAAATVIENNNNSDKTILEGNQPQTGSIGVLSIFRGMNVVRQFKTQGSEADIYLVDDKGTQRVVKLYRVGINPKQEILDRYKNISNECPEHVVVVHDTGFDEATGRWYEVLEYIAYGSLADALDPQNKVSFDFHEFVRELSSALEAIHEHDLIHRDIKPGNILIRSFQPLDLVFTDFGIASVLDSGASVRETIHGGLTPMYAAPEDVLGKIVSRPADWWACGMIFLEVLTGVHPFKGLTANRISYILATKGVPVDERINTRDSLLIKGLLTRDDKLRWSGKQVNEWLKGKKDIPVFYEKEITNRQMANDNSFVFMSERYDTLHDLAIAFASSCEAWEAARGMLSRGNVSKWLQDCHQFDDELIVSEKLARDDADEYVLLFILKYAPELPFTLFGEEITPLYILSAIIKDKERSKSEKYLVKSIESKRFYKYIKVAKKHDKLKDEIINLIFKDKNSTLENICDKISILLSPEKFYWGPQNVPSKNEEKIAFLEQHNFKIITQEAWQSMGGDNVILSPSIYKKFLDGHYTAALKKIYYLAKNNRLLCKNELPDNQYDNSLVFQGSEREYLKILYKKLGMKDSMFKLIDDTLTAIKSINDDHEKLDNILHYKRKTSEEIKSETKNLLKTTLDSTAKYINLLQDGKIQWGEELEKNLTKIHSLIKYIIKSPFQLLREFTKKYILLCLFAPLLPLIHVIGIIDSKGIQEFLGISYGAFGIIALFSSLSCLKYPEVKAWLCMFVGTLLCGLCMSEIGLIYTRIIGLEPNFYHAFLAFCPLLCAPFIYYVKYLNFKYNKVRAITNLADFIQAAIR